MLYILKNESRDRLDDEYYNGVINDLIIIFEANIDKIELKDIEIANQSTSFHIYCIINLNFIILKIIH